MATWDSYTQKATPEDNDTLMIKDTVGAANKRTPFSGVWNWIVNKLTSAVISNLQTNSKSIIPAINELNSKSLQFTNVAPIQTVDFNFPGYSALIQIKRSGLALALISIEYWSDEYTVLFGEILPSIIIKKNEQESSFSITNNASQSINVLVL